MTVKEMHYELKLRFNKLDNAHRRYLTDIEVDRALNEGVRVYVDKYVHGLTDPRTGLEVNQKSIDMLRTLIEDESNGLKGTNELEVIGLPEDYRHYVSCYAYAKDCPNLHYQVRIEPHGALNTVRRNTHRRANPVFRTLPGTIEGSRLLLYTDGLLDVDSYKLTYIRKPATIALGTYKLIDAEPQDDNIGPTNCDLPEDYHAQVVDLAIDHLARVYNMEKLLQITKDKIATAS